MSDNRSIEFIQRHIGPSEDDQNKMLSYLGHSSMEEFINKIVPQKIIDGPKIGFGVPINEWLRKPLNDWGNELRRVAILRIDAIAFGGLGYLFISKLSK